MIDPHTEELPAPPEEPLAEEYSEDLVVIRRNLALSGAVGGAAVLLGAAYLVRGGLSADLIGSAMLALGLLHLVALGAWRVPLLVADAQGIRLRVGMTWRGLPWTAIRQVVVEEPVGRLREGRLVVVPRDPVTGFSGLGALARLHLRWGRFWYGAPLGIPLGPTTVVDSRALGADLVALAGGRAEIVDLLRDAVPDVADGGRDLPAGAEDGAEPVDALRLLREPSRAEVLLDAPAAMRERRVSASLPEQRTSGDPMAFTDPDQATSAEQPIAGDQGPGDQGAAGFAQAAAWALDPGAFEIPVTEDELVHGFAEPDAAADAGTVPAPGAESVIGAKIHRAREMLDLTVEELSARTSIRPHVIEAIEADDFGPCGGDFYVRGHLTAVCRVLGLDAEPLIAHFEAHHADGPIEASRVFEAELSSGLSGGMRSTLNGPRWSLLIGSVLCLAMVWGLARMFAGADAGLAAQPAPGSSVAGLAANQTPIVSELGAPVSITVTASYGPAHVVVRDRTRRVLWSGDLRSGRHRTVVGSAPFQVSSDNAGAVTVTVAGKDRGVLGAAGLPGSRHYR